MSDLVGNHIVGFPTRLLIYLARTFTSSEASNQSTPFCHLSCNVASICTVRIMGIQVCQMNTGQYRYTLKGSLKCNLALHCLPRLLKVLTRLNKNLK